MDDWPSSRFLRMMREQMALLAALLGVALTLSWPVAAGAALLAPESGLPEIPPCTTGTWISVRPGAARPLTGTPSADAAPLFAQQDSARPNGFFVSRPLLTGSFSPAPGRALFLLHRALRP